MGFFASNLLPCPNYPKLPLPQLYTSPYLLSAIEKYSPQWTFWIGGKDGIIEGLLFI